MEKETEREQINDPEEISEILKKDEKILWQGKPKRSAFLAGNFFGTFHFAFLFGVFAGLLIYFCIAKGIFGGHPTVLSFVLGAFLVIFCLPIYAWVFECMTAYAQYKNSEYVFTDRRVIAKKWRWGRYLEVEDYKNVITISHVIKRVGKLFNVGDVVISCKDKKIVFRDVEDPANTARELRLIAKAAKENE